MLKDVLSLPWDEIDLFLVMMLLGLLTAVLNVFFKKKKAFVIALLFIGVGSVIAVFLIQKASYTTFEEEIFSQKEEVDIPQIRITLNDVSESPPERVKYVDIKEKAIIELILSDFRDLELKKLNPPDIHDSKYTVFFTIREKLKDNHFQTTTYYAKVDEDYFNHYEIMSEVNHLQTIETLEDDDNIEWQLFDKQ